MLHKLLLLVTLSLTIHGTSMAKEAPAQTSAELYCKAMPFAFIETFKYLGTGKVTEEKMYKTADEMEAACNNGPAPGATSVRSMSAKEIVAVSCLGFAEGVYIAYTLGVPVEPYRLLLKRRTFAANACASSPKKFQEDIFKRGPDYVLGQKY